MSKLAICVSTLKDRAENLSNVLLDPMENVRYIIVHQVTEPSHQLQNSVLGRKDVTYKLIFGKGVSRSRNLACSLADDDEIIVLTDDDVTYNKGSFWRMRNAYKENPGLDVCVFKIKTLDGEQEYKIYDDFKKRIRTADDLKPVPSIIEMTFIKKSLS